MPELPEVETVCRGLRAKLVDKRIDRLADEVSELQKLTVGIGERVSRNEGRIDVILDQMRAADTPSP